MREARSAALATTLAAEDRWPYASLVATACDVDGGPILLLSDLSDHTRNLKADPRASLLFEDASDKANPQTGPRVTVLGRIERSDLDRHCRRFLARHPKADLYAGFADFAVYRMSVERAHYVGGFARAHWISAQDLMVEAAVAENLAVTEPQVLECVNNDHAEATQLCASRLLGRRGDGWAMAAVDPDGCDLRRGSAFARLAFSSPVADAKGLKNVLATLAEKARSASSKP
jgi:putative heme iron utilization protein